MILDKHYQLFTPWQSHLHVPFSNPFIFQLALELNAFFSWHPMMCMEIVVKIFTQLTFLIVDMCSRLLSRHVNSSEAAREENERTVKCYTNDSRKRSQNDNNKRLWNPPFRFKLALPLVYLQLLSKQISTINFAAAATSLSALLRFRIRSSSCDGRLCDI